MSFFHLFEVSSKSTLCHVKAEPRKIWLRTYFTSVYHAEQKPLDDFC